MLLSLDQASRVTGWSVFEGGKLMGQGTFSIPPSLSVGEKLTTFMDHLDELYAANNFHELAFEDIQLQAGNVKTYKILAMIQAIIIYWCEQHNIVYEILSPSHWRKILKEKYNIEWGRKRIDQKQAAIEFVESKYNIKVDSDTADSICLGSAYILEHEQAASAF